MFSTLLLVSANTHTVELETKMIASCCQSVDPCCKFRMSHENSPFYYGSRVETFYSSTCCGYDTCNLNDCINCAQVTYDCFLRTELSYNVTNDLVFSPYLTHINQNMDYHFYFMESVPEFSFPVIQSGNSVTFRLQEEFEEVVIENDYHIVNLPVLSVTTAQLTSDFVVVGGRQLVRVNVSISNSSRLFSGCQFRYITDGMVDESDQQLESLQVMNQSGVYIDNNFTHSVVHDSHKGFIIFVLQPTRQQTSTTIMYLSMSSNATYFSFHNTIISDDHIPTSVYPSP